MVRTKKEEYGVTYFISRQKQRSLNGLEKAVEEVLRPARIKYSAQAAQGATQEANVDL